MVEIPITMCGDTLKKKKDSNFTIILPKLYMYATRPLKGVLTSNSKFNLPFGCVIR